MFLLHHVQLLPSAFLSRHGGEPSFHDIFDTLKWPVEDRGLPGLNIQTWGTHSFAIGQTLATRQTQG
jgi:hypothetical protein